MDANQIALKMKQHSIIYAALGAGQLFAMLSLYMVYNASGGPANEELVMPLQVAAVALIAGGIGAGFFLYNGKAKAAREANLSVEKKLDVYRTATIIQWALCEGPSLFCAVSFFMTGDATFLLFFGIALLFFLLKLRPSIENFHRDFN
jgi:hypothetical protein